jgi:hypothetical protein
VVVDTSAKKTNKPEKQPNASQIEKQTVDAFN